MRLWTIHPKYLDAQGFVGLWREALLAQRVLYDQTQFYRHHPQVLRFQALPDPQAAIVAYLEGLYAESLARGYHFARWRIHPAPPALPVPVMSDQLAFELEHLKRKLALRAPRWLARLPEANPEPHPLYYVVKGGIEPWEKAA